MYELLMLLGQDKNIRQAIKLYIDLLDSVELQVEDFKEVQALGQKLSVHNNKLMLEVLELKKDKAALSAFIEDNVTDTELLNQIFKG